MKNIVIQFDYLHGPLWKENYNEKCGEWSTGITCIDNDQTIQALNDEAAFMYASLYSFEPGDSGCRFDESRFNAIKGRLRTIVRNMINRLDTINDGSYRIVDNATKDLS